MEEVSLTYTGILKQGDKRVVKVGLRETAKRILLKEYCQEEK